MALGNLDSLLPDVRHYAQGAPDVIIMRELRNACAEFLTESFIWKDRLTLQGDGSQIYDLSALVATGARLVRVEKLLVGKHEYEGTNPVQYNSELKTYEFYIDDELQLHVTPAAKTGETIQVTMSLKNSRNAMGIPEKIMEDWADTIVTGAVARLCAMPERTWSSVALATWGAAQFRLGIKQAINKAQAGNNRKVTVAKFQW